MFIMVIHLKLFFQSYIALSNFLLYKFTIRRPTRCPSTQLTSEKLGKLCVFIIRISRNISLKSVGPGVKGIIGMHLYCRFNMCLAVVLLWCENTVDVVSQNQNSGPNIRTNL